MIFLLNNFLGGILFLFFLPLGLWIQGLTIRLFLLLFSFFPFSFLFVTFNLFICYWFTIVSASAIFFFFWVVSWLRNVCLGDHHLKCVSWNTLVVSRVGPKMSGRRFNGVFMCMKYVFISFLASRFVRYYLPFYGTFCCK